MRCDIVAIHQGSSSAVPMVVVRIIVSPEKLTSTVTAKKLVRTNKNFCLRLRKFIANSPFSLGSNYEGKLAQSARK